MRTVEFAFDIGNLFQIKDSPDLQGRVTGLRVSEFGLLYCGVWWQDGRRLEEWLHEWELEPAM